MLACAYNRINSQTKKKQGKKNNLQVPSSDIALLTIRSITCFALAISSSVLNNINAWKFPSPTWPTIVDTSPNSAKSFLVSYTKSGSFDTGTLFHVKPCSLKEERGLTKHQSATLYSPLQAPTKNNTRSSCLPINRLPLARRGRPGTQSPQIGLVPLFV